MVRELFRIEPTRKINTVHQLWNLLDEALLEKKKGNTQLVAAFTSHGKPAEFSQSLRNNGFDIQREWGRLFLVSKGNEVPFYALLQDSIIYFITRARKTEDIPGTILNYINSTEGVVLIRLGSGRMISIRTDLAKNCPGLILSYFTAHRETHTSIGCAYRDDFHRTIIYSGNDGFDTLEEMEYHYGVIPRIMEFHTGGRERENERENDHEKMGFRFDVNGIFTIIEGTSGVVRSIIEKVILEQQQYRIPLPKEGKRIQAKSILRGVLTKKWNRAVINKIEVTLAEEWDITGFLQVHESRGKRYSARLVDVVDKAIWEIQLKGREFSLIPVRGAGMRSLMKIIEVMEDHLGFQTVDIPMNEAYTDSDIVMDNDVDTDRDGDMVVDNDINRDMNNDMIMGNNVVIDRDGDMVVENDVDMDSDMEIDRDMNNDRDTNSDMNSEVKLNMGKNRNITMDGGIDKRTGMARDAGRDSNKDTISMGVEK